MKSSLLFALVACSSAPASKTTTTPEKLATTDTRPLFERLGGQTAIDAVVKEFVQVTGDDPRIAQYFTNVDKAKLEASMDVHICSITGGGCKYEGKSMLDAHTGMKLPDDAFAAFMDDLEKVLTKFNVPAREKQEVLDAFTGMKPDVVNH